jgi:hypothetical protein
VFASKDVPVVLTLGAKFSGLPSEQYTSVFAINGCAAISAEADSVANRIFFMDVSLNASPPS